MNFEWRNSIYNMFELFDYSRLLTCMLIISAGHIHLSIISIPYNLLIFCIYRTLQHPNIFIGHPCGYRKPSLDVIIALHAGYKTHLSWWDELLWTHHFNKILLPLHMKQTWEVCKLSAYSTNYLYNPYPVSNKWSLNLLQENFWNCVYTYL